MREGQCDNSRLGIFGLLAAGEIERKAPRYESAEKMATDVVYRSCRVVPPSRRVDVPAGRR